MNSEQFDKTNKALGRIAAAILAGSIINAAQRKPTLKEVQTIFDDCSMIVDPRVGTQKQTDFQARLDKHEW